MASRTLPVAIIGAGPVGLAAAAHLVERGAAPLILEAGDRVGASVRRWSHVEMFSSWEYNLDRAAAALLEAGGWRSPDPAHRPTGGELVRDYLEPLAALPALAPHIRLGARVTAVGRRGFDKVKTEGREAQPFVLHVTHADGREEQLLARAVIDASGTWTEPNPAGAGGLPAPGERVAAAFLEYGIPDALGAARDSYAGRRVAVIGSGHSAINALLDLAQLAEAAPGGTITWVLRKTDLEAAYGGEEADALAARGALGSAVRRLVETGRITVATGFRVARFAAGPDGVSVVAEDGRVASVDRVIVATGFRPDLSITRELRLSLDPWLECPTAIGPLIDPNLHSCGTVRPHGAKELAHPEPDFYVVGMKAYGRAPTFLLATGNEQVRSVVAKLMGDEEAAARVELSLPETGICTARPRVRVAADTAGPACCGPKTEAMVEPAAAATSCCGPAKAAPEPAVASVTTDRRCC